MDINAIEKIIELIENSSVKEFSYKDNDVELYLRTKEDYPASVPPGLNPMMPAVSPAGVPLPTAETSADSQKQGIPAEDEEFEYITSPIVATFYAAPAPDMPHFVEVGNHVKAGQTVCILEAMKLMNEIPAEFDCEIESVLVSNEQRVEYGQPLFRVKKL